MIGKRSKHIFAYIAIALLVQAWAGVWLDGFVETHYWNRQTQLYEHAPAGTYFLSVHASHVLGAYEREDEEPWEEDVCPVPLLLQGASGFSGKFVSICKPFNSLTSAILLDIVACAAMSPVFYAPKNSPPSVV